MNGNSERQETRDALTADGVTVDGGCQSETTVATFNGQVIVLFATAAASTSGQNGKSERSQHVGRISRRQSGIFQQPVRDHSSSRTLFHNIIGQQAAWPRAKSAEPAGGGGGGEAERGADK